MHDSMQDTTYSKWSTAQLLLLCKHIGLYRNHVYSFKPRTKIKRLNFSPVALKSSAACLFDSVEQQHCVTHYLRQSLQSHHRGSKSNLDSGPIRFHVCTSWQVNNPAECQECIWRWLCGFVYSDWSLSPSFFFMQRPINTVHARDKAAADWSDQEECCGVNL